MINNKFLTISSAICGLCLLPIASANTQYWAAGITAPDSSDFKIVNTGNNIFGELSTIPMVTVQTNPMNLGTVTLGSYTPKGWYDVNKMDQYSSQLCWAATASNLLQW